jgi:hypothetical protein
VADLIANSKGYRDLLFLLKSRIRTARAQYAAIHRAGTFCLLRWRIAGSENSRYAPQGGKTCLTIALAG